MTDLGLRSAVELVATLQKGDVGARELLDHYVARVERLNPALNAVVTLDVERARKAADAADAGARPRRDPRSAPRLADDGQGYARDRGSPHDGRRDHARRARAGDRRDRRRARPRRRRASSSARPTRRPSRATCRPSTRSSA